VCVRVCICKCVCVNVSSSSSTMHGASLNPRAVVQCVAVCCSVLQCIAVRCSVLQCAAVCCSVLQSGVVKFVVGYSWGLVESSCCDVVCYSVLQ